MVGSFVFRLVADSSRAEDIHEVEEKESGDGPASSSRTASQSSRHGHRKTVGRRILFVYLLYNHGLPNRASGHDFASDILK